MRNVHGYTRVGCVSERVKCRERKLRCDWSIVCGHHETRCVERSSSPNGADMERAQRITAAEGTRPTHVKVFCCGAHGVRGSDFASSTTRCGPGDDFAILVERRRQIRLAFTSTTHAVLTHESPRSIVCLDNLLNDDGGAYKAGRREAQEVLAVAAHHNFLTSMAWIVAEPGPTRPITNVDPSLIFASIERPPSSDIVRSKPRSSPPAFRTVMNK